MKKDKRGKKWYSEQEVDNVRRAAFKNGWNQATTIILEALPKLIK